MRRVDGLLLGTVQLFQAARGPREIYLRTSRPMGFQVRSGDAADKPVGIPDGVQSMQVLEWSIDPLSTIAAACGRIYRHEAFSSQPTPAADPLTIKFVMDVRRDAQLSIVQKAMPFSGELFGSWDEITSRGSLGGSSAVAASANAIR